MAKRKQDNLGQVTEHDPQTDLPRADESQTEVAVDQVPVAQPAAKPGRINTPRRVLVAVTGLGQTVVDEMLTRLGDEVQKELVRVYESDELHKPDKIRALVVAAGEPRGAGE